MNYKTRLRELVAQQAGHNRIDEQRKATYDEAQREAFKEVKEGLAEILEEAGSTLIRKFLGEAFANLTISGPGSKPTTFDIEPNYSGGSLHPSPAPGFRVKVQTSYDNSPGENPHIKEFTAKSTDELLEEVMRCMAGSLAAKRT